MIAADSSSLVAYFSGASGEDVRKVTSALALAELMLPPVVLTELLSDPRAGVAIEHALLAIPLLAVSEDSWARAGHARRRLARLGLKAKVADALIAQACIDSDVALITRDRDFRHFARHCGLKLA